MKYTRSRELVINVAKYETVKVSAGIEFDDTDIPKEFDSPGAFGDSVLNDLLDEEINEAVKAATNPDTAFQFYRDSDQD